MKRYRPAAHERPPQGRRPLKPGIEQACEHRRHERDHRDSALGAHQLIQNSLDVLMAHALELVRASEILGGPEDNTSMFTMLRSRAFPLVDPALPHDRIARVENLLAIALQ